MKDREKKFASPVLAVIAVVFLVLLPVLYFLSWGPVYWLAGHGHLSADVLNVYRPFGWLCDVCGPFNDFAGWYLSLFFESKKP